MGKKFFATLFSVLLIFSLGGCGFIPKIISDKSQKSDGTATDTPQTEKPTTEAPDTGSRIKDSTPVITGTWLFDKEDTDTKFVYPKNDQDDDSEPQPQTVSSNRFTIQFKSDGTGAINNKGTVKVFTWRETSQISFGNGSSKGTMYMISYTIGDKWSGVFQISEGTLTYRAPGHTYLFKKVSDTYDSYGDLKGIKLPSNTSASSKPIHESVTDEEFEELYDALEPKDDRYDKFVDAITLDEEKNQVLVDTERVKITYLGKFTGTNGRPGLLFDVENKTDKPILVSDYHLKDSDDHKINVSCTVAAHSTRRIFGFCPDESVTSFDTVSGRLVIGFKDSLELLGYLVTIE